MIIFAQRILYKMHIVCYADACAEAWQFLRGHLECARGRYVCGRSTTRLIQATRPYNHALCHACHARYLAERSRCAVKEGEGTEGEDRGSNKESPGPTLGYAQLLLLAPDLLGCDESYTDIGQSSDSKHCAD